MELMYDMLAWRFRRIPRESPPCCWQGTETSLLPQIDVPEGHHYLSHHGEMKRNGEDCEDRPVLHAAFRPLSGETEKIQDVDEPGLHNSMIVYGCGNCDGDRHNHDNLPVVLAGAGGGTLQTGRYLKLPDTPMTNLYLSMLDRLEIEGVDQFGDSTGRIDTI